MRDEPLQYTTTDGSKPGTVIVKLTGPLTLSNIFTFQSELKQIQPPLTIFDLTDSEFMDSAGLGVLINFYVSAEKNARKMALAGVNERIDALLEMTHVKKLLRVFPDVQTAEASG